MEKELPRYYIELLGKGLDVIDVLRRNGELRLTEVADAAHLDKSTTFRILHTLEKRGYVSREPLTKKFKLTPEPRKYRVGYAALSAQEPFSQAVTQGLIEEATKYQVELLVTDNRFDPEEAVKNAAWLIRQRVDFVIEFQVYQHIAPMLADMFAKAKIPAIAIDIPQPGAIYFGANNYSAGLIAGEALGRFVKEQWRSRVDRVVLLELPDAGRIPQERIIGTFQGIRNILPDLSQEIVLHRDSKGTETGGYKATLRALRSFSPRERLLIAAVNDSSTLGALRAVREAKRECFTAIIGHGYSSHPIIETEIKKEGSSLIGSVAYFPEKYGARILPVILKCLKGESIPPAIYTEHKLITIEA